MWDGLRKGSIYPVFIGDTGRKRDLSAKRSQQLKLEIAFLIPKLSPWPPFEYTSKAALFPFALSPGHACRGTQLREWGNYLGTSFLLLGDWVVLTFKLSLKPLVARLQRNSNKPFGPWGFPLIIHLGWPFFLNPCNCTAQSLMPLYLQYHLLDACMSYLSIKLEDLGDSWKKTTQT